MHLPWASMVWCSCQNYSQFGLSQLRTFNSNFVVVVRENTVLAVLYTTNTKRALYNEHKESYMHFLPLPYKCILMCHATVFPYSCKHCVQKYTSPTTTNEHNRYNTCFFYNGCPTSAVTIRITTLYKLFNVQKSWKAEMIGSLGPIPLPLSWSGNAIRS